MTRGCYLQPAVKLPSEVKPWWSGGEHSCLVSFLTVRENYLNLIQYALYGGDITAGVCASRIGYDRQWRRMRGLKALRI